jgi:methylmalonyl-CoA mutase
MRFTFALGSRFFMEVAKLRAARLLWAQVVKAFGGDDDAQKMHLHVRSATFNKTRVDPYVNMLRTTIEGFAGAVGGIDSMDLAPFDMVIGPPDEFSRRVARNQQLILQHEAHLTRVIDPAGGSYFVEMLTDRLARDAWAEFQRIEASGGMAQALQQGIPQQAVAEVAAQRAANIAQRHDIMVGINRYPHRHDQRAVDATDYTSLTEERAEAIRVYRASVQPHYGLDNLKAEKAVALMDTVIAAFKGKSTLGEVMAALRDDEKTVQVQPVKRERGAALFEALRANADAYTRQHGHPPQIFLANMGPLKQHKARADFAQGFFQVGGFEVLNPSGFETSQAAAQAALESGAPALVICSTDTTYPEIVPPLVKAIKSGQPETVVILAGYPEDQIDAHRDAGVDEFIHLRANCYEVNHWLQQRLGIGAE